MKTRNSNFEILRIICILMIISFHYVFKGGFSFAWDSITNRIIYDYFYYLGEWGVNIFILISGYYLNNTKFKLGKLFNICAAVYFYLLISRIIFVKLGVCSFIQWSYRDWLFPILNSHYWFVTAYIYIYVLVPYLQVLVNNITKKNFERLLCFHFVIWSVYPTLVKAYVYKFDYLENMDFYNRFIWLLGVYLLGCYIRMYDIEFLSRFRNRVVFLIGSVSILLIYIWLSELNILQNPTLFWTPNSIMEVMLSVSLFLVFEKISVKQNKVINYLASCTLGIYMLHDGELQSIIWQNAFDKSVGKYTNFSWIFYFKMLMIIFFAGILTEFIRQCIIKGLQASICLIKNINKAGRKEEQ